MREKMTGPVARTEVRWLIILGLLALALRLGAVHYATAGRSRGPGDDDGDHLHFAHTLAAYGVYTYDVNDLPPDTRFAWRPPLFNVFVAAVYKLHGIDNYLAVRIYLAIFSLIVPLCCWYLGRFLWSPEVGLLACAWACIHPPFIYYAAHVQADGFFLNVAALAITALLTQTTLRQTVITGILLGLACLGRSQFLGVLGIGALWCLMKPAPSSKRIWVVPYLVAAFAVISPWWVRNYTVFHKFVPFSTEGGYTLWIGNNPLADGGGDCYPSQVPKGLDELQRDKWHYNEALTYMRAHPRRTAELGVSKVARFWGIVPRVGGFGLKLVSFLTYFPMFVFSLAALWMFRDWIIRALAPFLAFALFYTAIQSIFPSVMRYRLPLEPVMICMASAAIWSLAQRERPARPLA